MTITVANTANTNTFDYWRNRTNELADAMTNYVVTTDSNTAVGNAAISGQFYANVLVANSSIRGGNVTTNGILYISTNTQLSVGNTLSIGNSTINTNIAYNTISVGNSSVNTQIVAGNVYLNGSLLRVGNTSDNVSINSSSISIGTFTVNNTVISVDTQIDIGNTTVNAVINSTSFSFNGSLFANSISITPPASNIFSILANTAFKIPEGNTASRPTGATGLVRYNTTDSKYEVYLGGQWDNVVTESVQLRVYNVSNTQVFP